MRSDNHPMAQEEMMAYLDGELPVGRAGAAARHLEQCRECQVMAADFGYVSRRLLEWDVEEGEARLPRTFADLEPKKRARPFGRRWVWALFGTAVVALSVVVITWKTSAPKFESPQRAASLAIIPVRKIAHSAQLTLNARDFDKARTGLEDVLKRYHGYLGQLTVNSPSGSGRTLDATLRIPAGQRDAAIADIKRLGRVETESQTGEDVTSEYVDLDARLTNARNTEQRLTEVLRQRTGKLSDVLEVEKEISRVRGEIEQMEAQKKTLTNRVEFLTLDVRIAEEYRAELQMAPDSMAARFRNATVAGYRSMAEGAVATLLFLLAYGPSVLLWVGILFFPARFAWRKLRS